MNDKLYIKFDNPKKESSPQTERLKKRVENIVTKVVSTIIPKANPDFEHLIEKVDYWKIEYNTKENATWREIGFDKNGNSILAMPFGNNYGFWVDNQLTLDDYQSFNPTLINADDFENDWIDFEKKK